MPLLKNAHLNVLATKIRPGGEPLTQGDMTELLTALESQDRMLEFERKVNAFDWKGLISIVSTIFPQFGALITIATKIQPLIDLFNEFLALINVKPIPINVVPIPDGSNIPTPK